MIDIRIDLDAIPYELKTIVELHLNKARTFSIDVLLSDERYVNYGSSDDMLCNGFFDDPSMQDPPPNRPQRLHVACGQPLKDWMVVLIHEGSHMDQWIEGDPTWEGCRIPGVANQEALDFITYWTEGLIELNEEQKWDYIQRTRAVEIDCEIRSAHKIEMCGTLSELISPVEYIQKANAYLYFHNIIGLTRCWYTIGNEPYNIPAIWQNMPTTFAEDYTATPHKILEVMIHNLFPEMVPKMQALISAANVPVDLAAQTEYFRRKI